MVIQNEAVKLDGQVVEPRHKIEIFCPNCDRDVDETELTNGVCNDCCVLRSDGTSIPFDPANRDYTEYLEWLSKGNTPIPADEPTLPE